MGRKWEWSWDGRGREWKVCQSEGDEMEFDEKEWKAIIHRKVEEYGLEKWRRGMDNKTTMELYRKKKMPKKESYYDGGGDSVLLFRARAGSLEVNRRTHRFNEFKSKLCHYCELRGRRVEESITHLLTECEAYEIAMDWVINKYKGIMGERKFEMKRQDEDRGLGYLLGLEEGVPGEIVRVSKQYINWVWKIREREIEGWKQEIRGRGDEIQRDDHERE